MKIGFTGTRAGMHPLQASAFTKLMVHFQPKEFHHGDCIGADDQAADMLACEKIGPCKIVCHPPIKEEHRAFNKRSDETLEPLSHFARNRQIVDQTDMLVVCPLQSEWQPRGGTWYTHDYALKRGKTAVVIWPDGTMESKR